MQLQYCLLYTSTKKAEIEKYDESIKNATVNSTMIGVVKKINENQSADTADTAFMKMCIRDRPISLLSAYRSALVSSRVLPTRTILQIATTVSYTHLDVYKRQDHYFAVCKRTNDADTVEYGDHRDLHSFPTRRSSDLSQKQGSCRAPAERAFLGHHTRKSALG